MSNIYRQQSKLFQAWYWVAYIPVPIFLSIHFSQPEEHSFSDVAFVLTLILLPLAFLLLLRFRLTVDKEKITYQYFPIQLTPRHLLWAEVESAQLVFFDPLKHYWGYGYRKSRKYGWVYNTTSHIGLLIKTKNQKVLNLEITDQKKFSQFVQDNQLNQIHIEIVNLERAFEA